MAAKHFYTADQLAEDSTGVAAAKSGDEGDGAAQEQSDIGGQDGNPSTSTIVPDYQEVFVGGLPATATDEEVRNIFAEVGEVLNVRLNRRRKAGESKGFAFVRYKDQLTAERACKEITEVHGQAVGVHISRPRQADISEEALLVAGYDLEGGVNKLLALIHGHPDRKAAIAAAIKAVTSLQPRKNGKGAADGTRDGDDLDDGEDSIPDPTTFLEKFPRCKSLVEKFRENPNTSNKTPLAILHEYATRLNLELQYEQKADSNLGPFTTGAKLTSMGGAIKYAAGEGKGRSKKEAKQVTAAAVLENLLESVPVENFLQSAKKVPMRGPPFTLTRGASLRGRGRGRIGGSLGRYPPTIDYPLQGPYNGYSGIPGPSFDLPLAAQSPSLQQQQQALNAQDRLQSFGNQHAQSLRSYLAADRNNIEIINSLRGQSLDSSTSALHRHLTANLVMPEGIGPNSRSFDNSGFSIGNMSEAQQDFLRQRGMQVANMPAQQQLPHMQEAALPFNNLTTQANSNLFSQQPFHPGSNNNNHLNFPRF